MGEEEGVVLSLINSHISQFRPDSPRIVWSRILEFTNNWNPHAGSITPKDIPEDLQEMFEVKPASVIPEDLARLKTTGKNWQGHPDATYLALVTLIGAWHE